MARPKENMSTFLERSFEAYWQYIDIDLKHPDNMRLVNMMFIRVPHI